MARHAGPQRRTVMQLLTSALVCFGLGLPTLVAAQSTPVDMNKLVADAKAEGKITIYTATPENMVLRTVKAFREKYGIEISYVRLSSNQLKQRFAAEAES